MTISVHLAISFGHPFPLIATLMVGIGNERVKLTHLGAK
jgi:hypothetical protein